MTITVRCQTDKTSFKLGMVMHNLQRSPGITANYSSPVGKKCVASELTRNLMWESGWLAADFITGGALFPEEIHPSASADFGPPEEILYRIDRDLYRHGDRLSAVHTALQILKHRQTSRPPSNEKNCSHHNFHGDVTVRGEYWSIPFTTPKTAYGVTYKVPDWAPPDILLYSESTGWTRTGYTSAKSVYRTTLTEMVDACRDCASSDGLLYSDSYTSDNVWQTTQKVFVPTLTLGIKSFTLSWPVSIRQYAAYTGGAPSLNYVDADLVIRFKGEILNLGGPGPIPARTDLNSRPYMIVRQICESPSLHYGPDATQNLKDRWESHDPHDLAFSQSIAKILAGPSNEGVGVSADHIVKLTKEFHAPIGVKIDIGHLWPATYYSTADAIKQADECMLDVNHYETLSELGELRELLPTVQPLVEVFNDLKSRQFLAAGGKLADAVSDYYLKWSFGQRPTLEASLEIAEKYDRILSSWNDLSSGVTEANTMYGAFTYDFPEGQYGLNNPRLIARSKVIVRPSRAAPLVNLLGLQRLGLKPGLSAAWDLVPMSWLYDWAVNLGDRFEAIDDRVMVMLTEFHYLVHSIRVEGEIPDTYWSSRLPSGVVVEPPIQYRFFSRSASVIQPALKHSKFDFSAPPDPPPGIAAAFMWKTFT